MNRTGRLKPPRLACLGLAKLGVLVSFSVSMASSRKLDELRHAADCEPSRFAKLLVELLASDFDLAFERLKTQKLLHRSRSDAWILEVERCVRKWLPRAPLSGKKRAHLARHFALCIAVQGMLDLVDRRSHALGIWRVPTHVLLEKLFSFVEEQRDKLWSQLDRARTSDERPIRSLTGAEADRRELRDYCDWVGRIVNQISILGIRKDGSGQPSEDEIREALNLAALTDLILDGSDSCCLGLLQL